MPILHGQNSDADQSIDIEKIKDIINEASFKFEVITVKGAPIPKVSKYADQPTIDPKYQRVKASLSIDAGRLPPNEANFLLDTFDRFSTQENGKLILVENCNKLDFNEKAVSERILNYAHQKIDKAFSENNHSNVFELPAQQVVQSNDNKGLFGWLRKSVNQGVELGR